MSDTEQSHRTIKVSRGHPWPITKVMVQPTSEISIPKTGKGIQPYSQETVKRQFCLKENIEGSDFLVSGFPSDPQA